MTPPKRGPPPARRAMRFWRISSLTERVARSGAPKGERLRAPRVSGYDGTEPPREDGAGERPTFVRSGAARGHARARQTSTNARAGDAVHAALRVLSRRSGLVAPAVAR